MLTTNYNYKSRWCVSGGDGGEGLQTFRGLADSANHLLGGDEGEGLQTFRGPEDFLTF